MDEVMDKSFKPTEEWMAIKYSELNRRLFRGELSKCNFEIFTSGNGSEGGILGKFSCGNSRLMVERGTGRLFIRSVYGGVQEYIHRYNFYTFCQPTISLNGNYTGTEHGFLGTLVHEMCHYYTYMEGYCPKQGHGPEFRHIAQIVSSRSNGEFAIEAIATAEDMNEFELNDEMKAKKEAKLNKKKASMTAMFIFDKSGKVALLTTTSSKLINEFLSSNFFKVVANKAVISKDPKLIDLLFSKGYDYSMRSITSCRLVTNEDFVKNLDSYETTEYLSTNEHRMKTYKQIIREVIEEYVDEDMDDSIPIGGINLGLKSPIENEI